MDPTRFDSLARAIATRPSRRQVLRGLGGGLAALLVAKGRVIGRAALAPAPPAATPGAATPAGTATYTSPSYHFSLTYDPAEWQRVPQVETINQGASHLDRFRLDNGTSEVTFDAYQDGRGDPEVCLQDHLSALATQSGAAAATPATDESGAIAGTTPEGALYAAEALTLPDAKGRPTPMIAFVECRRLLAGQALIAITQLVPAADYEAQVQPMHELVSGLNLGGTPAPAAPGCGNGETRCGETCVDTMSDAAHCGACGTGCAAGQVCRDGTCAATTNGCPAGQTPCAGGCVDLATDNSNCGQCGRVCLSGAACAGGGCGCVAGLTYCAGANVCANLGSDPLNCGACGNACASGVCAGGACSQPTCAQLGLTACGGKCANLSSDAANCGSCGNACPADQRCAGGTCLAGS